MSDGAANKKAKDQDMASRMKQAGEERTSSRCCLCYRMVDIGRPGAAVGYDRHLIQCVARTPPGSTKAHRYREATIARRRAS